MPRHQVLSQEQIALKMERMSLDIAARLHGSEATTVCLLGIQGNGWLLARLMAEMLRPLLPQTVQVGMIEMDKKQPLTAVLPSDLVEHNAAVIVCDDVSNSGQTMLYALRPLLAFPLVQLHCLVLVERMHNLFPVRADFHGLQLATAPSDYIEVEAQDGAFVGAWMRSRA